MHIPFFRVKTSKTSICFEWKHQSVMDLKFTSWYCIKQTLTGKGLLHELSYSRILVVAYSEIWVAISWIITQPFFFLFYWEKLDNLLNIDQDFWCILISGSICIFRPMNNLSLLLVIQPSVSDECSVALSICPKMPEVLISTISILLIILEFGYLVLPFCLF